jgi:recombinational DNA repair protein RecR
MAEFKRCDTCSQESPDKKGLFIANAWTEISVIERKGLRDERGKKYLVCDDCMDKGVRISDEGVAP